MRGGPSGRPALVQGGRPCCRATAARPPRAVPPCSLSEASPEAAVLGACRPLALGGACCAVLCWPYRSFETRQLDRLLGWLGSVAMPWLRLVLQPEAAEGSADSAALQHWHARLRFVTMQNLASLRIRRTRTEAPHAYIYVRVCVCVCDVTCVRRAPHAARRTPHAARRMPHAACRMYGGMSRAGL